MIRFGVIGTNTITDKFIQDARTLKDFSLTAVYSRSEAKAKEFAKKYDVHTTFTDLESMAKSDVIDAVYIASPNSLHAEQSILFMNHGKHVLCEKSIASHTRELEKMVQAATKNKVVLMEALLSTLLPNFQAIQTNLHKIGKVRRYFASFCQYSSRYDTYKEGTILNAFNPAFSNGALMDIGVYCIYPMVVLFGEPSHVQANAILLESGVDGKGSLLLKYEDMDAVIMYSKITNSYVPSEIQGENGSIIIDKISGLTKIEIRYTDGRVEDITQPQSNETMSYEAQEFIGLIQQNQLESTVNSHTSSMTTMKIMEEARKQIGLVFPADTKK
ncbi:Gfo/Idh/MocA family oxidoreductase [Bacillus sp. DX1.1]|uniref:Gfo/Idh/MocA family protein n=1 Tax=unclassified Bacillus (in: firmicutes) TaxID=185979 RepID=UPI002570D667|nr:MULTISPECIES: Gfo/Idh/MocA family oxidoreductase [unclassified Bacillus (in: firmicutes)]MDM5154525.1 Gfo/Idh/MocA family oxidoreductase [Bacillus sp. DX1.1]WJE83422.1 Gfo/Idh/MocA family oxidoreductase [Bacillus sp. DX3.1]